MNNLLVSLFYQVKFSAKKAFFWHAEFSTNETASLSTLNMLQQILKFFRTETLL